MSFKDRLHQWVDSLEEGAAEWFHKLLSHLHKKPVTPPIQTEGEENPPHKPPTP